MFSTAFRQRQEKRYATGIRPWLEALESRTVLSTFKVNTLLDTVAVNLQTGKDASGHVSLRSAIMAADARPNADTIIIPGGTYQLTIAGANEDNSATGDLDIRGNVTITGKSSSSTIIDGNSLDRVFQILSGKVSISKLTIQHGLAGEGGGLLNSGGQVTLSSLVVENNLAEGTAGANGRAGFGISPNVVAGTPIVNNGGNGQDGSSGAGGGIFNAGSMTLTHCTIALNQAVGGSGGQGLDGANGLGLNGTPSNDHTVANGQDGVGGMGGNGGAGGLGNRRGYRELDGGKAHDLGHSHFSQRGLWRHRRPRGRRGHRSGRQGCGRIEQCS